MKEFHKLMEESTTRFKNADHMVYVTYPLINDPKLIIIISEHLYHSILNAINAILEFEYYNKRVDHIPEKLESKLKMFKEAIMRTYGFSRNILVIFEDLHRLIKFRAKSPIEFIRKSSFVIADNNYSTKMINFEKIKGYVNEVKPFINKTENIMK